MYSSDILIYALLGGIIPAVFWLQFWLKESNHEEPRGIILGTFLTGMLAVLVALPLERMTSVYFSNYSLLTLTIWAASEELLKFGAAYFVALKTRFADEPIDATIYLMTAALGFSALENTFFILAPLMDGNITQSIVTLNLRFIGATLLHVISSGVIGIAIGYAFFKKERVRKTFLTIGIFTAIVLHTVFNSFIIRNESNLFVIFSAVWVGLIVVIVVLEKIKKIKNIN